MDDNISGGEELSSPLGEQSRVTGTGSDQVDGAGQRRFTGSGRRFGRVNAGRPGSTLVVPGRQKVAPARVEDHLGHLGSEPGAVAHRSNGLSADQGTPIGGGQ